VHIQISKEAEKLSLMAENQKVHFEAQKNKFKEELASETNL